MAIARGDLYVSDERGGITCLSSDGRRELSAGRGFYDFLPNGFSLLPDRSLAVANLGNPGGAWGRCRMAQ